MPIDPGKPTNGEKRETRNEKLPAEIWVVKKEKKKKEKKNNNNNNKKKKKKKSKLKIRRSFSSWVFTA